jgi:hypothetical protein
MPYPGVVTFPSATLFPGLSTLPGPSPGPAIYAQPQQVQLGPLILTAEDSHGVFWMNATLTGWYGSGLRTNAYASVSQRAVWIHRFHVSASTRGQATPHRRAAAEYRQVSPLPGR